MTDSSESPVRRCYAVYAGCSKCAETTLQKIEVYKHSDSYTT